MKPRREFIKTTSTALLALAAAPMTMPAAPRRAAAAKRATSVTDLHCSDFAGLLGATFSVRVSSGALWSVTLAEVEDKDSRVGHENFSLLFRGSLNRLLSQGTYEFTHRRLGTFALFIVPARSDRRNSYYAAVFNRIAVN